MDEAYFRVLAAIGRTPRPFDVICEKAGARMDSDSASMLRGLIGAGLVLENDHGYSLTEDGVERLDIERDARLSTAPDTNPEKKGPGTSLASTKPSSTLAPLPQTFQIFRDKWSVGVKRVTQSKNAPIPKWLRDDEPIDLFP